MAISRNNKKYRYKGFTVNDWSKFVDSVVERNSKHIREEFNHQLEGFAEGYQIDQENPNHITISIEFWRS